MADDLSKKGGLLRSFDKALTTGARYLSVRGYLMWLVIVPTMAATALDPTLLGIASNFVEFAAMNFSENFVDGWSIIGEAAFDSASDFGGMIMDATT